MEEDDDFIPDEMMEGLDDRVYQSIDLASNDNEKEEEPVIEETAQNEPAEELNETYLVEEAEEADIAVEENEEETVEDIEDTMEKKTESRKHANLEEMAANNTYVSRFEKLADTSKPKQDTKFKKKKKKDEESVYKVSNKELEKQLKEKLAANKAATKPIYTEEELAEIEAQQEAEEEREYDIDYDEYEDFYDEDDN